MSHQDVQHHYENYDPCPHGADSACPECDVIALRAQCIEAETEIINLQELLQALYFDTESAASEPQTNARAYLKAHGLLIL